MRSILLAAIGLPSLLLASCGDRSVVAYGDANSMIVAAPDSLWSEVADTVHSVLEPTILTVRDERTFELTQIAPDDPHWAKLRFWRQVVVIGRAEDPWVAPVLDGRSEAVPSLPAILERDDVWAQGQRVTAVVLPPESESEAIVGILPELHRLFDDRFRNYVQRRMFTSGRNDSLSDALRGEAGYSLLLPNVYKVTKLDDTAYLFRNDNPVGNSDLNRTIVVTWRPGTQAASTPEAVLDWRDAIATRYYDGFPQTTGRDRVESGPLDGAAAPSLEVQGIWHGADAGFPMAGPFITRAVVCPAQDRTYLIDAWLYAPGKSKYEYMLQLQTILGTFECGV